MGVLLEVTGTDLQEAEEVAGLEIEEEHGPLAESPENLSDGTRMATDERTQPRTDFSLSRFLILQQDPTNNMKWLWRN